MNNHDLKIELVSVDALKPAIYNPRKWSAKQIADLKESIKRFGMVDPIIVNGAENRKGIVIGGHFRLKVAKDLGYNNVPVCYINIPSEEKERELNLRLNANTGSFDLELLKSFDLNLLLDVGFDSKSLSPIWNDLIGVSNDDFDVEKEVKKIKNPKTKPGDKFIIANQTVLCADSTDPKSLEFLLGDEKADVTLTDMPFNISLDYDGGLGGQKSYGGHVNDSKSEVEYRKFVTDTIKNALDFSKKDAHFFWYSDENYIWLVQTIYKELGIKPERVCLWIKNNQNPTSQNAFNKCYEPCTYGTVGKPYLAPINNLTEVLNAKVGTGNSSAEQIQDLLNVWVVKRLPASQYNHPTEKPIDLHEKAIRRCSRPNDVILDLFGGSGGIACCAYQLKRRSFTIEREPVFCDLIIKRLEQMTGEKARKVGQDE